MVVTPSTCFRSKASVVGGLSVNLLTQLSNTGIHLPLQEHAPFWNDVELFLSIQQVCQSYTVECALTECMGTKVCGLSSPAGCCASRLQVAGKVNKILANYTVGLLFTKESQRERQSNVFTCAKTFCNSGTNTVSPNHYYKNQLSVFHPCLLLN